MMPQMSSIPSLEESYLPRAQKLFERHKQAIFERNDRLFAGLLVFQWLAAILAALFISPLAWSGTSSSVHVHVWTAVILGGAISSLPVFLAIKHPGAVITRHAIAAAQMLYSALFIHLSGGRIETHFHVFGSLALLAFYRDWKVLITASTVVAADHLLRGFIWPQSVYGILSVDPWRWSEHAFWVIVEDIFLIMACRQNVQEMKETADRQAALENLNQLWAQEERFRILCNLSPMGIFQTDAEGKCSFVNPRWTEITSQTLEESVGDAWMETIYGEDRRAFATKWETALRDGTQVSSELRMTRHDGSIRWVRLLANAVRTEFGTIRMLVGTIEDITERKQAEIASSQLARIVELTSDAVYTEDLSGEVTSWNEAAAKLFGYTAKEMLGTRSSCLMPEAARQDEPKKFLESIAHGQSIENFETLRLRKDGSSLYVAVTASPLRNASGHLVGSSIIARDVTQKKDAEKRISEFYSMVSHELRTPLTSIRGALSLIDDGVILADSDEGRELISIAKTSSIRLVRLINEILDLRKIEAGKLELHMQSLSAASLANSAVDQMRGMANELGVNLTCSICTASNITADHDRITQVLTNLISNALKFSPAGSTVTVRVSDYARSVRFAVIDRGPGIPLDQQSKLFEKFQQLDSSDTRAKEGTGLGLAISKAIIEQHEGRIGFDTEVNQGSTFYFDLSQRRTTNELPDRVRDEKPTLLIVEDDSGLAKGLSRQLEHAGYSCQIRGTKSSAIAFLEEFIPDVVLLDLGLPDGNGIEIIEVLKSHESTCNIPVIVMTGDEGATSFGLPLVFDLVLKPFDQKRLLHTLERALRQGTMKRVLIVDDDPDVRAVIAAQLRALKILCLQAGDGAEAAEIAQAEIPDLVIMDVGMPNLDGFQLVERLRQDNQNNLPLIVYSGLELTAEERDRLTLGLTKHLTKGTISEQEFFNSVKELLEAVAPVEDASSVSQAA